MTDIETNFRKINKTTGWESQTNISVPNRGLNFGDGVFETMYWNGDSIRFFDQHLIRLEEGLKVLNLSFTEIDGEELIGFMKNRFPGEKRRLRWNIFRTGSGKYTPGTNAVTQLLEVGEFHAAPPIKRRFGISQQVKLFPTAWSHCKTLNALPYVLANHERHANGWDEIILLDYREFLSEAGSSNLFWMKDGRIFTPSLSCSCINGVSRRVILNQMYDEGIAVMEGEFKLDVLEEADLIFVSNISGISYLAEGEVGKYSTDSQEFLVRLFE